MFATYSLTSEELLVPRLYVISSLRTPCSHHPLGAEGHLYGEWTTLSPLCMYKERNFNNIHKIIDVNSCRSGHKHNAMYMYQIPYLCPVGGWWDMTLTATGIRGGGQDCFVFFVLMYPDMTLIGA